MKAAYLSRGLVILLLTLLTLAPRIARPVAADVATADPLVTSLVPAAAHPSERNTQLATQAAGTRAAAGSGIRLYTADWSGGFGGWTTKDKTPLQGHGWYVAGGELVSDGRANVVARAPYEPGKHGIADYALVAKIRVLQINTALPAPHSFGQWARGQGVDNNYGFSAGLVADQTPMPQIYNQGGVSTSYLTGKRFVLFDPLTWHSYREEVVGAQIRYLIDGVVVLATKNEGWKDGGWVGLFASGARIAVRSFTLLALGRPSAAYAPACGSGCGAGTVLYQANWSQGVKSLLDWSAPRGDPQGWSLHGGMLVTNGGSGGLVRPDFAPGDLGLSAYAVEAQIKLQGIAPVSNPTFALRIHGQGIESGYGFDAALVTPAHDAVSAVINDAAQGGMGGKRFVIFDPSTWHTYRVDVVGRSVEYLIDGVPVVVVTSDAWKYGGFGGISFNGARIAIRSFRIIALNGATLPAVAPCTPHCGPSGVGYVLPTSSLSAHNLLDWELVSGTYNTWHLAGGTLVSSNDGAGSLIKPDYEPGAWKRADYAVQAEIAVLQLPQGGSPSYGVIARGQGIEYNYGYQASMVFNGTGWDAALYNRSGGQLARKTVTGSFALGSWHTIRIEVSGASQVRMLVDGVQVLTGSDNGGWKYGGWAGVYYSGPQIAVRSFTIQ